MESRITYWEHPFLHETFEYPYRGLIFQTSFVFFSRTQKPLMMNKGRARRNLPERHQSYMFQVLLILAATIDCRCSKMLKIMVYSSNKMSTWTSFVKIWTVDNCEFNANFVIFLGFYHLLFALETIGVSWIIIWWLIFEKKPFQFWREIWIWIVVILLQL